jgi:hypothetical protein
MHTQIIDYAAIKDRLKSLQPKNRADTRYAHLAELKEELRDARKRGVSVNTLSAELKAAGITISSGALAKYLSRRSSNLATKRTTTAAKPNHVPEPHGQVKTGTKEPEHRQSGTGPEITTISNPTCSGPMLWSGLNNTIDPFLIGTSLQ